MSYDLPPMPPERGPMPPVSSGNEPATDLPATTPPPAKKPRRLWAILAASAAALVLLLGGTIATTLALASDDEPAATAPLSAWDREQRQAKSTTPTTAAEPTAGPTPSASEITLTPKVTDKQCFGSAGCNVTIKVEMAYSGPTLSEDDTWSVTYEIKGDESGLIVGTLELTGTSFTASEESLSTKTSKTKVTIGVTDVEKVGY